MNTFWKAVAIVAVLLGLMALVASVRAQRRLSEQVEMEVQKQLKERERSLVERYQPVVSRMGADIGQPKKEYKTLEDVLDTFIRVFDILGELPDQSTNTNREAVIKNR